MSTYVRIARLILGIVISLFPAGCFGQLLLPQIADGGNWRTVVVVANTTNSQATVTLNFFQDTTNGATASWVPPFAEITSPGDLQNFVLPAGATKFLHTPGTAPLLTQGWGQVTGSSGVQAYAIYTYLAINGRPDQDGTSEGVPAASRLLVPFDNTLNNVTSIALVNPNPFSENVGVNIQTDQGVISHVDLPSLPAQGQIAFVTGSIIAPMAGQKGMAEFYVPSGTISIASFRFNPMIALTSSPVFLASGKPVIGSTSTTATPFISIALTTNFSPSGLPASPFYAIITPKPDGSYVANVSGSTQITPFLGTFVSGVATNRGKTFNFNVVSAGGPTNITSGTLSFNLTELNFSPTANVGTGTVAGNLTLVVGGSTYSGVIGGTYAEQFQTQ